MDPWELWDFPTPARGDTESPIGRLKHLGTCQEKGVKRDDYFFFFSFHEIQRRSRKGKGEEGARSEERGAAGSCGRRWMCLTQERTALPLAGPPVHMPELTAETLQLQCQPTAVCSCVQLCLPAPHYWILTQQQPLFQRAPHSFSLQQCGKHGLLLAGSFGEDFTPPRNSVGCFFFT